MNSIESIKPDELIEEYGEWLKHEPLPRTSESGREINAPDVRPLQR